MESLARRRFLRLATALTAGLALAACRPAPQESAPARRPHRTPYLTPGAAFFSMSSDPHFRPPLRPGHLGNWTLEVVAADGRRRPYRYPELAQQARHRVMHTVACIGNPVGGELIGNARWQVQPLKELLAPLLTPATRAVRFEALDGYYSTVSLERALDDHAFIALGMNGAPLSAERGFPARVLLPDLYALKQPRWLRRIRLLESEGSSSVWEKRGWAGEVAVKSLSRFDAPGPLRSGRASDLTGMAYAGARGVAGVEISFDNGRRWLPCEMLTPNTPHVWSLWRYRWQTPPSGTHSLVVRAIDGSGEIQSGVRRGRFPDGASGYDSLTLTVRG